MVTRAWEVGDRVAEHADGVWHLGTVAGTDGNLLAIRFDGGERATFRLATSPRIAHPDDVPIDERHWLPEQVRDQLVRKEAARRLRAMVESFPAWMSERTVLLRVASDLDDPLNDVGTYSARARALLSPAPAPATTP